MCRGEEFLEGIAGLLEARFRHRSHVLWNLETAVFAHGPTPVLLAGIPARDYVQISLKGLTGLTPRVRRFRITDLGSRSWTLAAFCNLFNAAEPVRFSRIKVIAP